MAFYIDKTIGLDKFPILHVSYKKHIIRYGSHRYHS